MSIEALCVAEGYPPPDVTFDDKYTSLDISNAIEDGITLTDNGRDSFRIRRITKEDTDIGYKVKVEYEGLVKPEIFLWNHVISEHLTDLQFFRVGQGEWTSAARVWSFSGFAHVGRAKLISFPQTSFSDAGQYQCTARTPTAVVSKTLTLVVVKFAQIDREQSNVTVLEDGSLRARCVAEGYPPPDVTFDDDEYSSLDISNAIEDGITLTDNGRSMELRYLEVIVAKLTSLDMRLTSLDQRITSLDQSVTSLDQRMTSLDQRLTSQDQRFVSLQDQLGVTCRKPEATDTVTGKTGETTDHTTTTPQEQESFRIRRITKEDTGYGFNVKVEYEGLVKPDILLIMDAINAYHEDHHGPFPEGFVGFTDIFEEGKTTCGVGEPCQLYCNVISEHLTDLQFFRVGQGEWTSTAEVCHCGLAVSLRDTHHLTSLLVGWLQYRFNFK
nr:hypothetical protein BaRGS_005384 [Batillaria attramentaria]